MGFYDNYLSHHGILGQRWGRMQGPPYPLGSGDHSSSEKKAASAAGIKVGKDSGKGSIENVKGASGSNQHKKKAPLTEEEKRLKAQEASLKGDDKTVKRYMDKLTTQELQDAQTRVNIRKNLEGNKDKKTKKEREIEDAILSGDKEKVRAHAKEMTTQQLNDAMYKIDLMQKLNYEPPAPTTTDKINKAMKQLDNARNWMQSGLAAYDALAAINNTFNKDNQWPRVNQQKSKDQQKAEKKAESTFEKIVKDVAQNKAENDRQETIKRQQEMQKEQMEFQKKVYKDQQKAAEKAEKEAKKAEKAEKETRRQEEYEKYSGDVVGNNSRDPFDTSTAQDASWRDVSIDSSSSSGSRAINNYLESSGSQYLLEDKERA